jgi:hypothetical protein
MLKILAALAVCGWLAAAGLVWSYYHLIGSDLRTDHALVAWPLYALVLVVVALQVVESVFVERGVGL